MSDQRSKILLSKTDNIIDAWAEEARDKVSSSTYAAITYEAVYSQLPHIIDAIAIHLSSSELLDPITIPVKLGFDISELLRGFRTLRRLVCSALELSFSNHDAAETMQKVEEVLDHITASTLEQHVEHQLEQQSEPTHKTLLHNNQELIRIVQKQKDNASYLAHELKNPLNAIISFASILLGKWTTEEAQTGHVQADPARQQQTSYLEKILDNGKRVLALIDNMLDASRNASQSPSLKVEQVEISQLIERVTESFESSAREKGLALTINCSLAPPIVHTDSLRLQQIFVNLVSNAIRYTDSGQISIRCYGISDEQWAITVSDTGRGISADEQPEIFKPYVRAGLEESHLSTSSGLGLTIVSKLTELLKGEVNLTSELGKGSTFTVTLPIDTSG